MFGVDMPPLLQDGALVALKSLLSFMVEHYHTYYIQVHAITRMQAIKQDVSPEDCIIWSKLVAQTRIHIIYSSEISLSNIFEERGENTNGIVWFIEGVDPTEPPNN
jgi:hypothetical protein